MDNDNVLLQVQEQVQGLKDQVESLKVCKQHLESLSLSQGSIDGIDLEITRLVDLLKLKEVLEIFRDIKRIHEDIQESVSPTKSKNRKQVGSPMKLVTSKPVEHDLKLMEAVDHFSDLKSLFQRKVQQTCPRDNFLREYSERILSHWNVILLKELTPRFDQILTTNNWPIVSLESLTTSPNSAKTTATSSFDNFFLSLLKIDVNDCIDRETTSDQQHTCLPMELMMNPFKKRFQYHFMSTSRTNQLEKPEWFLTQTLNWIKDNSHFLNKNVDPLLRIQERDWPSGRTQLTITLLQLCHRKLEKDLPDLAYDDKSFSHCVDEVHLFLNELNSLLGKKDSQFVHSIVDLFDPFVKTPQYFTKLLSLEKKTSSAYVDSILDANTAWNSLSMTTQSHGLLDDQEEDDDRMVPEAADNFVLLIHSIMERSQCIRDSKHKEAFIDLMLELIDDFRLRLTQLTRSSISELNDNEDNSRWPFSPRFYAIINALSYLKEVMEEWSITPFFLDEEEVVKSSPGMSDSRIKSHGHRDVQDKSREEKIRETICLLQHMLQEMQSRIVDSFGQEVKLALSSLSHVKWFSHDSLHGDEVSLQREQQQEEHPLKSPIMMMPLSPQECQVIHFISSSLSLVKKNLCKSMACLVIKSFAFAINRLLLEEVILRNSFSDSGALKLHRFICQHLITLFRNFISRPEASLAELVSHTRFTYIY